MVKIALVLWLLAVLVRSQVEMGSAIQDTVDDHLDTPQDIKRYPYSRKMEYGWNPWLHTPPFYDHDRTRYVLDNRRKPFDGTTAAKAEVAMNKRHLGAALNTRYGTWHYKNGPKDDLDTKRFLGSALKARYRNYGSRRKFPSKDDTAVKRVLGEALNHGYTGDYYNEKRKYGLDLHPWERGSGYHSMYNTALSLVDSLMAHHLYKRDVTQPTSPTMHAIQKAEWEEQNNGLLVGVREKRHIGAARSHGGHRWWMEWPHNRAVSQSAEKRYLGAALNHGYGKFSEANFQADKRSEAVPLNSEQKSGYTDEAASELRTWQHSKSDESDKVANRNDMHSVGNQENESEITSNKERRDLGPARNHQYGRYGYVKQGQELGPNQEVTSQEVIQKHIGSALDYPRDTGGHANKPHLPRNKVKNWYARDFQRKYFPQEATDNHDVMMAPNIMLGQYNQIPSGADETVVFIPADKFQWRENLDLSESLTYPDSQLSLEQTPGREYFMKDDTRHDVRREDASANGILKQVIKEGETKNASKLDKANKRTAYEENQFENRADTQVTGKRSIHSLAKGNTMPFSITKFDPSYYLKTMPSLTKLKDTRYNPKQKALAQLYGFYGGLVRHQLHKFFGTVN